MNVDATVDNNTDSDSNMAKVKEPKLVVGEVEMAEFDLEDGYEGNKLFAATSRANSETTSIAAQCCI